MIISASRRTDVPAFYGEWFMRRIRAGSFLSVNPFNPAQAKVCSLAPDAVEALVFWTKDPQPFLPHLSELDDRGHRYVFLFTLNDYPLFEPGLRPLAERVASFRELGERLGSRRVAWRYDPIIVSSATPSAYHRERVAVLAEALRGSTDRLIVSFADYYGKVERRLATLTAHTGITFTDIAAAEQRQELLSLMTDIVCSATAAGMTVQTCAEAADLTAAGVTRGACIDGAWLQRALDLAAPPPRDRNQRSACLCAAAVDVGAYNTCGFGCLYCYANHSPASTAANRRRHDPDHPALLR